MIRLCLDRDREAMYTIINQAAQVYRGVIPDDRWHDPYMSRQELQGQIDEGVVFWGCEVDGELVGVMGLQHVQDVTLIRHAYVLPAYQGQGIGGALLRHLCALTERPILIGTWADAAWAIRFYEKHGFTLVTPEEKDRLLRAYWLIPARQVETSVVLRRTSGEGAGDAISVWQLQAYLRHSARRQYEAVPVPGFTLFFHPTDPLPYFNYAIPDQPKVPELEASLSALRDVFAARGRVPRFEFIEGFAPRLAPALEGAGFCQETRQALMVCTAATARPAPSVPGLALAALGSASPADEIQLVLSTQRRGFDPQHAEPATAAEAAQFLRTIGRGSALLARLDGVPAAAGMVTAPADGLAEVVGLATLEPFRRRGIATALAAFAVREVLAQGAQAVFLSAADERAGRVYERVGFVAHATMLAYRIRG